VCCRYYYEDAETELRELLKAEAVIAPPELLRDKAADRDVFPSQSSLTIRREGSGLAVSEMLWGFLNPYRSGLIINARAETAREKSIFADSIAGRRCVIPASGFYEWDPYKARFRFTLADERLMLLAGFYHEEQEQIRYTILTTEANDSMIRVHDRMPVMIGRDEIRPWLEDDERLDEFLTRKQTELVCEQDSGQIRMDIERLMQRMTDDPYKGE
jgi:putative SOS response-associated peptidase YedK